MKEAIGMFKRPPQFKLRMLAMIVGIMMMGIALSVLMKLKLGIDPYACLVLGLSNRLHISYGNCHVLVQLIMFGFVIYFNRELIGFGTIGNMICLGYIVDFSSYLLDLWIPSTFWENIVTRVGMLLPSMVIFVVGVALYMVVELGVSPYDAIPFVLTNLLKKFSFKTVRIVWDFTFLSLGYLLGGTVGVVTLICVCFIGPVTAWMGKKIAPYLEEKNEEKHCMTEIK